MSRRGFRRQVRQQLEAEWRTAFQIAGARKLNIWMSETKLGAEVAFRSLLIPGWWIEVRYAKRHRIFACVPGVLPRLVRFFVIYSLLAFLLLVLVSMALDGEAVEEVSGHFYIRHSFPELPNEISKAEYQHQVAYLFWWISTLALVWGTLLFSMALRAFVRPWRAEGEPTQLSSRPVS